MTTPAPVAGGTAASGINTVSPAFAQETTAGNLLLAWVVSDSQSTHCPFLWDGELPPELTISGDGWALLATAGAAYNWLGLWYKADCATDETAPTFTDDSYTFIAALSEWAGVATSSPLDQYGTATQADPCQATSADSASGDLVVALNAWNGANANPTFSQSIYDGNDTYLTNGGFIQDNSGAASAPFYGFSYAVAGSSPFSAGNKVSVTITENEGYVSGIIASFLAAS